MKMPHKSTITPTLLLCLACLGLASTIYWQVTSATRGDRNAAPAAEPAFDQDNAIPDDPGLPVPPRERFAAVVERPLFSPTRRPTEQVAEAAQGAPSEPLDVDLLGVVIWRLQRLALVRPRNAADVMQLAVGGMVSGWTVVTIEPNRVTFRQGEAEQVVRLAYKADETVANDQ